MEFTKANWFVMPVARLRDTQNLTTILTTSIFALVYMHTCKKFVLPLSVELTGEQEETGD